MTEMERSDLPSPVHPPPFRIEDCLVLPALNRIECGQETHQIEPRVMQVLVCLAARPNEVLSRQMLFDVVWADSVVCEEALTRTISELRRVFRGRHQDAPRHRDDPEGRIPSHRPGHAGIRAGAGQAMPPAAALGAVSDPAPDRSPRSRRPEDGRGRPGCVGVGSLAVAAILFYLALGSEAVPAGGSSIPVLTEPRPSRASPVWNSSPPSRPTVRWSPSHGRGRTRERAIPSISMS